MPGCSRLVVWQIEELIKLRLGQSARVLSTTIWFSELGNAHQRCDTLIAQSASEGKEAASGKARLQAIANRIKTTLQHCWDEPNVDVFGPVYVNTCVCICTTLLIRERVDLSLPA